LNFILTLVFLSVCFQFIPRDAMDAAVTQCPVHPSLSVSLSVCHSPLLHTNG